MAQPLLLVMPGLEPGIHEETHNADPLRVDGRVKPGHDESEGHEELGLS